MAFRLLLSLFLCWSCPAWAAEGDKPRTAGPTVRVFVPPLQLPAVGHARGLRVYLPPDYAEGSRRYPVLYMFDGQNLFDDSTSYVGEWGVDESMDALARDAGFSAIVVGIDHGNELRFNELIPYWNVRFLPNLGEAFIDDVVHAIKPFIDANYRTLPDRVHTAIIGSSLGGLEADYAIRRHPQVFGRAGVFSPSYWVSDEAFAQAARSPLPPDTRIYLYMGGREGEESVQHVERMAQLLRTQLAADNVAVRVTADAEHNESAWRAEFPGAVRWLFDVPEQKAYAAVSRTAQGAPSVDTRPAEGPAIHIEDVDRFYQIYDAADGRPTAEQLQRDYLDPGSEGLHLFAKVRNTTGIRIAENLAKRPEMYSNAKRCMAVLPRVRQRLELALGTLARLYPDARLPPVTIAVGRGKPVGVGSPVTGLQIGLEALCATDWLNPDVEDRFVHVIAHEYAHVQQAAALVDAEHPTVLERSLAEGAAEFAAELISGKVAYSQLSASARGREKEIETAFVADADKTDLSQWLDNSTTDKPGDLGYWVGYRIVKSYYQRAPDKRRALREILEMTDPKAFLAGSGWQPGIQLE